MTIKAWHFINKRRRLGYGDGRVVRVGRTYKIKGDPVLCHWGLHGSVRIVDALEYASGPILCRVEIGGKIIKGDDKLVGTKRTVLSMVDITEELRALGGRGVYVRWFYNCRSGRCRYARLRRARRGTPAGIAVVRDGAGVTYTYRSDGVLA